MVWHNLLQEFGERLALRAGGDAAKRQAGAIPYTVVAGEAVFLLITSRGSGRWIFPKGDPIDGLDPWDAAAQEAMEEAGIEGEIDPRPLGVYRAFKTLAIRRKMIEVELYPLRVTRQFDDWPERTHRHRHWAILPEAKRLISDAQIAQMAIRLSQRVRGETYPPVQHINVSR